LPPPETKKIRKEKETNRSAQNEEEEKEEHIENQRTKLKLTVCCLFVCFAGHRRLRETKKRKRFPIH